MFQPSRDQVRQFFFETWRRYRENAPLEPLQGLALEHILRHPEYHAILDAPTRYQDRDYLPETGDTNPFLHLSMHLSISEQLSIDQPPGIQSRYATLLETIGDAHQAQHAIMDCLAEMIWKAQRHQQPMDSAAYLACMDEKRRR